MGVWICSRMLLGVVARAHVTIRVVSQALVRLGVAARETVVRALLQVCSFVVTLGHVRFHRRFPVLFRQIDLQFVNDVKMSAAFHCGHTSYVVCTC